MATDKDSGGRRGQWWRAVEDCGGRWWRMRVEDEGRRRGWRMRVEDEDGG